MDTASNPSQSFLERRIELTYLTAFYAGVLTEKQQTVLDLYCSEDMSLGEIARETGISRQAVYNMLLRTSEKLFHLEASLGMASRFQRMQDGMAECIAAIDRGETQTARSLLTALMQSDLQEDHP